MADAFRCRDLGSKGLAHLLLLEPPVGPSEAFFMTTFQFGISLFPKLLPLFLHRC